MFFLFPEGNLGRVSDFFLLPSISALNGCSNSVSHILKYTVSIKAHVNTQAVDSVFAIGSNRNVCCVLFHCGHLFCAADFKTVLKKKTTKQSGRHIYLSKGMDHDDEFFSPRSEEKTKVSWAGCWSVAQTKLISQPTLMLLSWSNLNTLWRWKCQCPPDRL